MLHSIIPDVGDYWSRWTIHALTYGTLEKTKGHLATEIKVRDGDS
jgi:hypothetical protein